MFLISYCNSFKIYSHFVVFTSVWFLFVRRWKMFFSKFVGPILFFYSFVVCSSVTENTDVIEFCDHLRSNRKWVDSFSFRDYFWSSHFLFASKIHSFLTDYCLSVPSMDSSLRWLWTKVKNNGRWPQNQDLYFPLPSII